MQSLLINNHIFGILFKPKKGKKKENMLTGVVCVYMVSAEFGSRQFEWPENKPRVLFEGEKAN